MKKNYFKKLLVCSMLLTASMSLAFIPTRASAATHFGDSFDSGSIDTQNWQKGSWKNPDPFNCTWRENNINLVDGKVAITLDKDTQGGSTPYSSGELRSTKEYGYGLYQVNMKPAKNIGVNSSFFTFTGPSTDKPTEPWDEIDIEFLGKDTTKVQFNYYTNGVGKHEYIYDLGFDASASYHTYSYEWHENCIIWRVDGEVAHIAYDNIPTHPGKIMMNLWNGTGVDDWLGAYDGTTPLKAYYDWMAYDQF